MPGWLGFGVSCTRRQAPQPPYLQLPVSHSHTAAALWICTCVQASSVSSPTMLPANAGQEAAAMADTNKLCRCASAGGSPAAST